ncbi:MAG: DNA-deoxyinosine glycosylase [Chryseobacterium jejuense]|uniref:DNA-deoxyinosine glycosylase n=1 Tax=Chryseobacterium jejuense TaxID=445960 RepID=UPI003D0E193D
MQNRISSFPPLIDDQSEILILGSIPGVKSLEMQQYYAHPQNKFWKIILELLNEDFTEDYSKRIKIIKKHHIALWDVIDSCERKGSLDSEIKNEEANQIDALLEEYPNVKAIFCNGGKSYKNLQKLLGKNYKLPIFLMPSTSPLHTISFERKFEEWKKVLEFLSDRV